MHFCWTIYQNYTSKIILLLRLSWAVTLIWFNCYMPTDPQTILYDEVVLLPILRKYLTIICLMTVFWVVIWTLIRGEDLDLQLAFVTFWTELASNLCGEKFPPDFKHLHTDLKSSSIIDHFFVSEKLLDLVEDAGPVHLGDNRSRHSPIVMKLNIANLKAECPKKSDSSNIRKPVWYEATELEKNEYTFLLSQKLADITPPDSLSFNDVNCQHEEHTRERDNHVLDLMWAIMEASYECIPLSAKVKSSGERNFKDDALFWHATWLIAGRPLSGGLYQLMHWSLSRTQYHYAVIRA